MKKSLVALLCLTALFSVSAVNNDVTFSVADFSKGLTPMSGDYVNDPSSIMFSQNWYTIRPGRRQTRPGFLEVADYDSINDTTTAGIDALATFYPPNDSSHLIIAAGGFWYHLTTGFTWIFGGGPPTPSMAQHISEIRPYRSGDSVYVDSNIVTGKNTRWVRDLVAGDSISLAPYTAAKTRKITKVICDTMLMVNGFFATDTAVGLTSHRFRRFYVDGTNLEPYLLQSGNNVFTGNTKTEAQVIFKKDSVQEGGLQTSQHGIFLKKLQIVDSFYIDSIYSLWPATAAQWDSVPRRGWDTTTFGTKMIREIQLVSRRKGWFEDEWFTSITDDPESYYVRVGFKHRTPFYQITGNTDTSIYLMAWYVDTLPIDTAGGGGSDWNDSLFFGKGETLADTIPTALAEGEWGYIFTSVGGTKKVVTDPNTDTLYLTGRGALCWTVDNPFALDSFSQYDGMQFIHLTANDVNFNQFKDSSSQLINTRKVYTPPGEEPIVPAGDSALSFRDAYLCPSTGKHYYDLALANYYCSGGGLFNNLVVRQWEWTISTPKTFYDTKESQALVNAYFPIRFIRKAGDTTFFITSITSGLTDNDTSKTLHWEVVKVGMPGWSGMTEWQSPPQLVGWGDTLTPSLVNFSRPNLPFDWSSLSDIVLGDNPGDPVVAMTGYDDQLFAFKKKTTLSFNGERFSEISKTDGLISPRALVSRNKNLFWVGQDRRVKTIQRRDLSGYTVENISDSIEPILLGWSDDIHGTQTVPFKISQSLRFKDILTYNEQDNHLWLATKIFDQTSRDIFTFSLDRGTWDGVFPADINAMIYTTLRDTSRIIMGAEDSANIVSFFTNQFTQDDLNRNFGAVLKSGDFWAVDQDGWPIASVFKTLRLQYHGASASTHDTVRILMVGDTKTDTISWTMGSSYDDQEFVWRSNKDNYSTKWRWEIHLFSDSQWAIEELKQMQIVCTKVERND